MLGTFLASLVIVMPLLESAVGSPWLPGSSSADWKVIAETPGARFPRGAERLDSAADRARYRDLAAQIHGHLHRGAHFTMAVTAGTIKELRRITSERDIPILIAMLSDKDPVAASAAQDVLVTFGMQAVGPLLTVKRSDPYASMGARSALRHIRNCYDIAQWDRWSSDSCPADRSAHRGEELPTELLP